ncbi:MAG TPA: hypothetical protein V6C97_30140 [Oculatellaceae cyanobacterium]
MYWRVRKLSVKDLALQNWVYLALLVSVSMNMLFIAMRPSASKGMDKELQLNYNQFARTVTTHLLDTSYITFKDSTKQLGSGELQPLVLDGMRKNNLIAKSDSEMEATYKDLYETRRVSAVRIDSVDVAQAAPGKPIPVEVAGVVVIHSSSDATPPNPVPFKFHYDMALRVSDKGEPVPGPDGKPLPMVVGFRDISPNS